MPESYPDFPHHTQIAAYFDEYVDHFGLRDRITFETGVEHAARGEDGVWTVELDTGETRTYDALLVANGHHWNPRWPEPAFPGADGFPGTQMHAHSYVDNSMLAGKRVVVLGMGNSAMDIAVESSYVAERTYLAARQGVWIVPKYIFGKPVDQIRNDPRIPFKIRQRITQQLIRSYAGPPERYGLPKPNHNLGEAHPTVSGRILDRIQHGTITPKPNIASFEGSRVRFADGTDRRGGRGRVLHRLQDHVPVLRRGSDLGAREPHRAVPTGLRPGDPEPVLHRAAAAARSDHAAGRGPGTVGRRLSAGRLRAAVRRRRCMPTSTPTRRRCARATWPPSVTRSRSTTRTTSTHSPRSAARAPSGRARAATGHQHYADLLSPQPLPRALPDLQQGPARRRRRAAGARRAPARARTRSGSSETKRGAGRGQGLRVRHEGRARGRRLSRRAGTRRARLGRRQPAGGGDRVLQRTAARAGRRAARALRRGAGARRRAISSVRAGRAS